MSAQRRKVALALHSPMLSGEGFLMVVPNLAQWEKLGVTFMNPGLGRGGGCHPSTSTTSES